MNKTSIKYLTEKTKQYINHKDWYKNSNKIIKDSFKKDYKLFIKLLGVTSPRTTVKNNTKNAIKTYICFKNNEEINFSYGLANKQIKNNVNKVLNNKPFGGQKVNSFVDSLLLKDGSICIDVWMLKAFNIKRLSPTNKDIRIIRHKIIKIAKSLNIKTYEAQACLWSYAKAELNNTTFKEYKDFNYYLKEYKDFINLKLPELINK